MSETCGRAKAADISLRIRSICPRPGDARFRPQRGGSDEQPITGDTCHDRDPHRQRSDIHEQGLQKRLSRMVRPDIHASWTSR